MIYSKEAYEIDMKQLMSEIENKVTNKELKEKLKIPGDVYLERIKIGYHQLINLKGFENEPYYIIQEQDNSFEYWLSFYLSLSPKHLISLILDFHYSQSTEPETFIQKIEHKTLPFMESVVFIPNEIQAYEITAWIRSKKITASNQNKKSNTPYKTKLFTSPFNILLKEGLEPFCEEESRNNLEQLFTTNLELKTPVILKRSFKIISLLRPMKRLISKGNINFNQKDAAEWISNNFVIRDGETVKGISIESSIKRFGDKKTLIEPDKAQIKYEAWFKKDNLDSSDTE